MDGSCSDDSEFEETERAGGGPGPTSGRSRRTGGESGRTTSIRSTGGALTFHWMTAETLRVRADIKCVFDAWICTVTTARKWDLFFLDQSDFKDAVESQIRQANKRIAGGNDSYRIQL